MKRVLGGLLAVLAISAAGAGNAQAGSVPFDLAGTAFYQFGTPAGAIGVPASPDTGFVTITNNGTSTFVGNISLTGTANGGPDVNAVFNGVLAPGDSQTFSAGPESSNVGGFNGPFGGPTPQDGLKFEMNGLVLLGVDSQSVDLTIFDKDIHSGVPRTNPFGVTLDNYILQGGDPFGRDNGDAYETTQAPGNFEFVQAAVATPEPTSLTLCGIGVAGLLGYGWRRKGYWGGQNSPWYRWWYQAKPPVT